MAAVTCSDEFFVDPRFDTLALHLGFAVEVARMRMISLWSWQTEHFTFEAPTYVVPLEVVIGQLKHLGAPAALVASGLADHQPGGLYIRGSRGKIEWLHERAPKKVKGGHARVANAVRDSRGRLLPAVPRAGEMLDGADQQHPAGHQHTTSMVANAGPSSTSTIQLSGIRDQGSGIRSERETAHHSSQPPGSAPTAPAAPDREGTETRIRDRSRPAAPPAAGPSGYQAVVARFDARYRAQNGGARPTWGEKPGAQLKRLIAQHGADEVLARIDRLFDGAIASWCRAPYDVGTLVSQFDRLATVTAPPSVGASVSPLPPGFRRIEVDDEQRRRMSAQRRREPISLEEVERQKAAAATGGRL